MTAKHWRDQPERGSLLGMKILVWAAFTLGRNAVRLLLWPITFFYMLVARKPASASRDYLSKVFTTKPSWMDTWKHFHCFATVAIDRLYFLSGRTEKLKVTRYGDQIFTDFVKQKQGCLLLTTHIGNFDAMRATKGSEIKLHIVMDHHHNAKIMKLFDQLAPDLANNIIDARQPGAALVLNLAERLNQGDMIGLMADRINEQEPSTPCTLLGKPVELPTSPWILALALKVPVILCFGIYHGKNHYSLHFELVSTKIEAKRRDRQRVIAEHIQQYADRMEYYVKLAPYNWFNFYDYWPDIKKDEEK